MAVQHPAAVGENAGLDCRLGCNASRKLSLTKCAIRFSKYPVLLVHIKDPLGHSSIKMTVDVYGHLEPGGNRQAVNKLPTIESAPVGIVMTASNS